MVLSGDQSSATFQRKTIYVHEIAPVQKWLIFSILAKLFATPLFFVVLAIDPDLILIGIMFIIVAGLSAHIALITLAAKLFAPATWILLAILTFVPFLGLGIMLWVNASASTALRGQGVEVGLFGARR